MFCCGRSDMAEGFVLVGHGHPHTIRAMRARKVPQSRAQNTAATASVAE